MLPALWKAVMWSITYLRFLIIKWFYHKSCSGDEVLGFWGEAGRGYDSIPAGQDCYITAFYEPDDGESGKSMGCIEHFPEPELSIYGMGEMYEAAVLVNPEFLQSLKEAVNLIASSNTANLEICLTVPDFPAKTAISDFSFDIADITAARD